ncbi:acyltransferase-domain-containing protein [Violaceomyces palustris]|uniref:Acyltransferase-domain-containing protein n=1 Tax=Violaceomyces palustris TaxID=1673888 RepID=A0ACD0NXR8_9BASI|nr:acyltransferase-domain-containing protein [Violaceomyces palustris]
MKILPATNLNRSRPLYSVPIPLRVADNSYLQTILFGILFNLSILSAHLAQLVSLPLLVHPKTRPYFQKSITYTKNTFARALVMITQFFGPTKLILSFDDGEGGFLDPEEFVKLDSEGNVERVDLPSKSIWMSNHQVYTDWLYLWILAYYSNLSGDITIILKKSLKWIPFVGWGMQFFRFIFLARSWNADKANLASSLSSMARHAGKNKGLNGQAGGAKSLANKLLLMIFPEGTLVSSDTRPLSKKYADKMGYQDLENLLLPRSTGLFFCVRALASEVEDLWLVNFTIGYPGIPPAGYGQSYYTLRSIFMQSVPPPSVHLHISMTRLTEPSAADGDHYLSKSSSTLETLLSNGDTPPLGRLPKSAEDASSAFGESTAREKQAFDDWLTKVWIKKDAIMARFYRDGDFIGGKTGTFELWNDVARKEDGEASAVRKDLGPEVGKRGFVEIPIKFKSPTELGDVFCWGLPWLVARFYLKIWRFFTEVLF